jgi:outer membrane receptor for ferrienterochelin and colicins
MSKYIYITVILVFAIVFVDAQTIADYSNNKTISGYIYDTDDNPLPFASVMIENTSITTYTNSKGYFSLEANVSVEIFLVILCHGFEDTRIKVKDNEQKLNITLTPKVNYLDEVVITGTRTERTLKDVPVLTKVISSSELRNTGSVTALDALENILPGVHFDPSAQMGDNIQIQGLDNNYVLILIDGERVVPERKESVNFSRLNVAEIERVEIINGASSVLYGSNAIGSVINIITKDVKRQLEGYVQGRYSKYNTLHSDASLGFRHKGLTSKTTLNYKSIDGYDLTPESPTSFTVNPNNDISIKQTLAYKFNKKIDASVGGTYYRHNMKNPPLSTATTHSLDNNYTINAKADYSLSDKNIITASAHSDIFKSYKVYEKKNDSLALDGDYYYSTLRITDTWTVSEKYQIVGGIEHNDERAFSTRLFGEEEKGQNKNSYNSNAFLQGAGAIIENLDGVLGLRYTNHSGFGHHVTSSFSLMYKLSGFRFRTGINSGFKAPTLKEMYYNFNMAGMFDIIGNPNLKSETSWYKFVSVEYINENINTSISLSHNKIADKINIVERYVEDENGNSKQQMHYQNIDDVNIVAVDAFVQCSFLSYFQFKTAYSFADAKDVNSKMQISGNSKHNLTSSLCFRYSKLRVKGKQYPFTIMLSERYSSPRIYESIEPINGVETIVNQNSNSFHVINMTYTQKIPLSGRWNAEIQAGIDNLFNYVDDKTFASINPGRRLSIMARINF